MKPTKKIYRLLAIAFFLLPATARAEGAYIIGVSGPPTEQSYYQEVGTAEIDPSSGVAKIEENSGFMIGIGKEFNNNLAVELFHASPGDITITGDRNDTYRLGGELKTDDFIDDGYLEITMSTTGIALKWHRAFSEKTRGFLKAGLHSWEAESNIYYENIPYDPSERRTNDGTDTLYGLGIERQISTNMAFIVSYDSYEYFATFNLLHIGLKYSF